MADEQDTEKHKTEEKINEICIPTIEIDGNPESDSQKNEDGCCQRLFPPGSKVEMIKLFSLAWPMVLTCLCILMVPFVSIAFCGHLGKTQLDAVAIANSLINITGISIAFGLCTACDTLFSQSFGSTNKKQTGHYLQKAILILSICCLPCWAVHLNAGSLLLLMGQDEEVARLAASYLLHYLPALFFFFMYQVLCKYIQNQNMVLPPVGAGILGNAVNVGLHYLFVYKLDMGTNGSALSQVGANFVSASSILLYIWISKVYVNTWGGWTTECLQAWGIFIKLAIPGMLMVCMEWWGFEIGTLLSGLLSKEDLGVQSVMFQMEGLAFMLPIGIGISVGIRVGQCLGSNDPKGAKLAARMAYCLVWITAIITAIMFISLRNYIPLIFTQDPGIIKKASQVIPILSLFTIFDALAALGSGTLLGCGRQHIGAVIVFVGFYVIAMPIGIPVLLLTETRVAGLWWAYAGGMCITSTAYTFLVLSTNWELEAQQAQVRAGIKPDTLQDEEAAAAESARVPPTINEEGDSGEDDQHTEAGKMPDTRRRSRLASIQGMRRASELSASSNGTGRRYSAYLLVDLVHGRRFSLPYVDGERKYSLPDRNRRYSTIYTPQITEDVLQRMEGRPKLGLAQIIMRRVLILAVCVGLLLMSLVIRLTVPHKSQQDAFSNITMAYNTTTASNNFTSEIY